MAAQEIRELLVEQARQNKLILLLGQDWPRALTGVPSNSELAIGLAAAANRPAAASLAALAQSLPRHRYSRFLRDNLPSHAPGEPYLTLAQLPIWSWLTLAYDDRLEQALAQMNRRPLVLVDDGDVVLQGAEDDRLRLIKLCGDVNHPPRLVVSRSEYQTMPDAGRSQLFLQINQWLADSMVLAVGCDPVQGSDFDLWQYRFLIQRQGGFQGGALLLWSSVSEADAARWADRNVTAVSTPDVPGFLEELLFDLVNQVEPPAPGAETTALKQLMQLLVGLPGKTAVNQAAAAVPDNQRLQSIRLTLRLKLSDADVLQSELDVRYIPDIQSHDRQWRDTGITLAELQAWAKTAARRRKLKQPYQNSPVEQTGIEFLGKMLAVDSPDWRSYAHALYLRQTFADSLTIVFELDDSRLWPIPWELLHDGQVNWEDEVHGNGFLGLGYPFYRRPRTISSPGQIAGQIQKALVLAADPLGNLTQLDGEQQWLVETLQNVGVQVDVLGSGDPVVSDPAAVKQKIRQGGYQLLHFIGHGQFDQADPDQSFLLLGRPGEPDTKLLAAELAQVAQESGLTFVFLSACQAGDAAAADDERPWEETGIVNGLLRKGVPAALGMRWNIGDVSARQLVTRFYTELVGGRPIEQAVLFARQDLQASVEWANPVFSKRHGVL
jgi:hypothetical protein